MKIEQLEIFRNKWMTFALKNERKVSGKIKSLDSKTGLVTISTQDTNAISTVTNLKNSLVTFDFYTDIDDIVYVMSVEKG